MINRIFRFFLTLNATSLLVIVYWVQKGVTPTDTIPSLQGHCFGNLVYYSLYVTAPILLTRTIIWLSSKLDEDDFPEGTIESIEHANNSFLPSYLGYFFVGLSIPNDETLIFVYSVLFVFTYRSQALYFNPLFLLFGYEFYNIRTKNGTSIFLISPHMYKNPREVEILAANRINNYTYLERK